MHFSTSYYVTKITVPLQISERFRNEGLNQGISRGLHQGEVEMLLRLMKSKFGAIDVHTNQQIHDADSGCLAKWSLRLLTANNIAVWG